MDKNQKDEIREMQWRQFARLGEMMGDGLHYEPDGKWIVKEYKQLAKILIPEDEETKKIKQKLRQNKNAQINTQIAIRVSKDKCKCGGQLKQTRSGSTKVQCIECKARYVYKRKKQ